MSAPLNISDKNFSDIVVNAKLPVLVDFWASWCMPCRMLAPVISEIASENEGKVIVGKINVDESPTLAEKYSVMSIPTLILFVNGQPKDKLVAVHPKETIEQMLAKYI